MISIKFAGGTLIITTGKSQFNLTSFSFLCESRVTKTSFSLSDLCFISDDPSASNDPESDDEDEEDDDKVWRD